MSSLVIVESPAKCKTINKYLGKDFKVLASYGHVRDLRPKKGAVDPEKGFAMKYEAIEKNAKHVDAIAKALKKADTLYLATDPDREGEAISWHVQQLLEEKGLLKDKTVHRVVFHEITKRAIQEAIQHPRELLNTLVDAQQARRALDYLVGFNLSPLLWKKIRRGLSAGRVQSPALRMITERQQEIDAFEAREYWTLQAESATEDGGKVDARLRIYQGEKLEQFSITDAKGAKKAHDVLTKAAQGNLQVAKVSKRKRQRKPAPPFITSTLQQEASRKLGFGASRTMRIAQQLYEGIDTGSGAEGLISYMRTDSVNLSQDALEDIRSFIQEAYGKDSLPAKPNVFKTKSKNAQEAHEAIRPTQVSKEPKKIKDKLKPEQFKLYDLIWKRAVACQMNPAKYDTVTADLNVGSEKHQFRATGSTLVEPGFLSVYQEGTDEPDTSNDEKLLPPLKEGQELTLKCIQTDQHFTEPPPRFSEASLVKALEEHGIGRPSTYASIISTLVARAYVTLEKKRFEPTDVGVVVNKFLTTYFTKYVDYNFTAGLEDELDQISVGEKEWVPLLADFWGEFKALVDKIETDVDRAEITQEAIDEECPECKKPLSIRLGRRGKFIGCTGYPECKYTRNVDGDDAEDKADMEKVEGRKCPKCESDLIIRPGRYGKFIGCSSYPDCKFIEPLNKPEDLGIACPECEPGSMMKRFSRYGKVFYSCSEYPKCKYAIWNEPIKEECPECKWPILMIKTTKRRGTEKVCPQKECKFTEQIEPPEEKK